MIAGHAYWRRVLEGVSDPETVVILGFLDKAGDERAYRGRIARTDSAVGPLVEIAGDLRRLCPWEQVRSVECPASDGTAVPAAVKLASLEAEAADADADQEIPF